MRQMTGLRASGSRLQDAPAARVRASALVVMAVVLAASASIGAQQLAAPVPSGPGDEAVRIGDRVITVREVDDAWRRTNAAGKAQVDQSIYDGRKTAIDRLIAETLVDQAAKSKNMTAEAYVAAEVAKRKTPIAPEDIEKFYNFNKAQMGGKSLAEMGETIRTFLEEQQRGDLYDAFIAELRKGGPPIRMTLDPPRQAVSIAAHDPVRGNAAAPITLVEFSDYQCPFCGRVMPTLSQLRQTYGDRLRIVWKDFPLENIHPNAVKASEAAWCAGEQSKYWEYHDRLFANQSTLAIEGLKQHAAAVGLDAAAFGTCLESGRHTAHVREGLAQGRDYGVDSTPTFFINGRRVTGAQPLNVFTAIVEDELSRVK